MQIGVADARARDPNQNLARILDSLGVDINDFERLVVRQKPSRLHATSYRAQSIWPLLRSRPTPGCVPLVGRTTGRELHEVFSFTLKYSSAMPPEVVRFVKRPGIHLLRLVAIASVAIFVIFVFSSSRSFAATSHDVNIGGVTAGAPLAPGGVVWFNGFTPGTIVITAGDPTAWHWARGLRSVTSTRTLSNGSFAYDSRPAFTPAGALADMGPGKLLSPGSVFELDTGTLATGTYHYFCKIHPGMAGNLTVTAGVSTVAVTATAGWGDSVYAVQAFAPEDLTVVQGTIVQWRLANPTEPHTITGPVSGGSPAWDSSPNFNPPGRRHVDRARPRMRQRAGRPAESTRAKPSVRHNGFKPRLRSGGTDRPRGARADDGWNVLRGAPTRSRRDRGAGRERSAVAERRCAHWSGWRESDRDREGGRLPPGGRSHGRRRSLDGRGNPDHIRGIRSHPRLRHDRCRPSSQGGRPESWNPASIGALRSRAGN